MNRLTSTTETTTTMPSPSPRFTSGTLGSYYKFVDSNAPEGSELAIWTIAPENLSYFIDIAGAGLLPHSSADVVVTKSQSKGGSSSVKRYPGDPEPFNRSNVAKTIMKNRDVRHGNALPGRRFVLDDGTQRRQFTYQGELASLHALLVGNLKMDVKFTNYNGSWEVIRQVTAEG